MVICYPFSIINYILWVFPADRKDNPEHGAENDEGGGSVTHQREGLPRLRNEREVDVDHHVHVCLASHQDRQTRN